MRPLPRAVFDTSSLIGALLVPGSPPRRALLLAEALYEVCVSAETLTELEHVVNRARFEKYRPLAARREFYELYASRARLVAVPPEAESLAARACRDPKDCKFLALACAAGAEVLVSSDDDLLVLDGWQGIAVVRPACFVEALDGRS